MGRGFSRDNIASRKSGVQAAKCIFVILRSPRPKDLLCFAKRPKKQIPRANPALRNDSMRAFPRFLAPVLYAANKKSPARNTRRINAVPFLAKSAGYGGPGGCPDLRRFADHSGGTVADSHGLPRIPNLLNVESKSMLRDGWCQPWSSKSRRARILSVNTHLRFGPHFSHGRQLLHAKNVGLCFLPPFKDKSGYLGYNARDQV